MGAKKVVGVIDVVVVEWVSKSCVGASVPLLSDVVSYRQARPEVAGTHGPPSASSALWYV